MAKNETLHIRVNDNVKAQAEHTLSVLGVTISEAVNMLLHQITFVGGLPFDVRIPRTPDGVAVSSVDELYAKFSTGAKHNNDGKTTDAP